MPVKHLSIFFLGDESMKMLAKAGEFVNRKGIYPSLPDADKIQAVEMDDFDAKGFKDKSQDIRKYFCGGGSYVAPGISRRRLQLKLWERQILIAQKPALGLALR